MKKGKHKQSLTTQNYLLKILYFYFLYGKFRSKNFASLGKCSLYHYISNKVLLVLQDI